MIFYQQKCTFCQWNMLKSLQCITKVWKSYHEGIQVRQDLKDTHLFEQSCTYQFTHVHQIFRMTSTLHHNNCWHRFLLLITQIRRSCCSYEFSQSKSVSCYDAPPVVVLLAFSPSEHVEESITKTHQASQKRTTFRKIQPQTEGTRVWHTEHKSKKGRKRDNVLITQKTWLMMAGKMTLDKNTLCLCLQSLSQSLSQLCLQVGHHQRFGQ